jgi:hypothetical protein
LYTWLREQPTGAVLELPIAGPALGEHTLFYQYATLIHRHPIMNGYSGTGSALQDFLASRNSPVYESGRLPDLLIALRAMGVRYVIVHPNWVASSTRAAWLRHALDGCADQMEIVHQADDAIAWRLKPLAPAGPARVVGTVLHREPSDAYSVSTPSSRQTPQISDDDPSTRWVSDAPQTGSEWLRIEFQRTLDARRIDFDLGWRHVQEYPRALRIESLDSEGSWSVLLEQSTLPSLLPALIKPGPTVTLTIPLPPNRSVALVVRQTLAAPAPWSVDDLRVWSAGR